MSVTCYRCVEKKSLQINYALFLDSHDNVEKHWHILDKKRNAATRFFHFYIAFIKKRKKKKKKKKTRTLETELIESVMVAIFY